MTNQAFHSAPSDILSSDSSMPAGGNIVRVSQEYALAFRTKSYAEMWRQLVESHIDSPVAPRAHLSETLLKPRSETLAYMTVGRLVRKLQDNIVHGKSRAVIAVGCMAGDLWKGIVKGLSDHGHCFMEQLDELEERICLCLLTINKSRMSVVHEIMNNKELK